MDNPFFVNSPFPKGREIGIEELKVTYVQNADTNDIPDHYQKITLSTVMTAGNELPYYISVSIPNFEDGTPGHWSLDLDESLNPILEDFLARLKYHKDNENTKKEK